MTRNPLPPFSELLARPTSLNPVGDVGKIAREALSKALSNSLRDSYVYMLVSQGAIKEIMSNAEITWNKQERANFMTLLPSSNGGYLLMSAEIVYVGRTNDLERREEEHRKDGKRFDYMSVLPINGMARLTSEQAEHAEKKILSYFRSIGINPKYNKDSDV